MSVLQWLRNMTIGSGWVTWIPIPIQISVRVLAMFCWEGASGREICGSRQKQTSRQAKEGHLINRALLSSNESLLQHVAAWPMPPQIERRKTRADLFPSDLHWSSRPSSKRGLCVCVVYLRPSACNRSDLL